MRCVIAGFPFEFTRSGVLASMKGVKPEPVTGAFVLIGRRRYPVKQVGAVITRQDRRDFTAGEVTRAMVRLGFECRDLSESAPASGLTPLQAASALLDGPIPESVPASGLTPLQAASALLDGPIPG